jgi:soluble lytic murein transglycosylase
MDKSVLLKSDLLVQVRSDGVSRGILDVVISVTGVVNMRLKHWFFTVATVTAALFIVPAYAQKQLSANASQDEIFVALRDAGLRNQVEVAEALAQRLPDYAIPSYVEYYRIRPRLQKIDEVEDEARRFLKTYDGMAIADRFRNDWLLELGRAGMWDTFDEQYPLFKLDDDTQLKCYSLMSRLQKGENVAESARQILLEPKKYGSACTNLIGMLDARGQFTDRDISAQLRLTAEAGLHDVMSRIGFSVQNLSSVALNKAANKPAIVLAEGVVNTRADYEAFLVALGRVARTDVPQAVNALEKVAPRLNKQDLAQAYAQIAVIAARRLDPDAMMLWKKAQGAELSYEGHAWRVRTALRHGNWPMVKASVEAMTPAQRQDATWRYWLGRAYKEEGNLEAANRAFTDIAAELSFYGQLAKEELGGQTVAPVPPEAPSKREVAKMAENAGLQRALKFYELGLQFEGTREWNWEARKMDDKALLAAAEFARQNEVLDRMVTTSNRTKDVVDFKQRFPSPHFAEMRVNTDEIGLELAWVYGLIRQESRFIKNARSHVGASGLMQIMPATAKYVANKIGLTGFTQSQINNIETNLLLGTRYLNMVLSDLDGSQVLATAAYNAGPSRARTWRSSLSSPMEGAIFAETIPFTETRGYVKNVLSNATFYAALFDNKPQLLKQRLGVVTPNATTTTNLP